jgi:hypothetical protein
VGEYDYPGQDFTYKLFQTVEINEENYIINGEYMTDESGNPHLVKDIEPIICDKDYKLFNDEVDQIVEIISQTGILNELYFSSYTEIYKLLKNYLREVDRYLDRYSKKKYLKILGNPFIKQDRKNQYIEIRTKLKENLGLSLSYMDKYVLNKSK